MRVENKSFYADLFSKPAPAIAAGGPARAKPQPAPAPSQAPSQGPRSAPSLDSGAIPPGAVKAAKALKAVPDEAIQRRTPPTASATPPSPRPLVDEENMRATGNLPAVGNRAGQTRAKKTSPLAELIGNVDTHNLTPRRMADLSLDLYAAGAISFDDYSLLAFQPELHPDFNRTIGALTGEEADPDRPRDFVSLWDDRAAFQRRHNAGRNDLIEQSERIASMLRRIDSPTNVMA